MSSCDRTAVSILFSDIFVSIIHLFNVCQQFGTDGRTEVGYQNKPCFDLIKQDSNVYEYRMRSAIKLADTLTLNAKTKWSGLRACAQVKLMWGNFSNRNANIFASVCAGE